MINTAPDLAPSAGDSLAALRDLMGLLALPALWAGRSEETILQVMTDAVSSIVPIAVIFAQVRLPPDHSKVSLFRLGSQALGQHIPHEWQAFAQLCDHQADRSILVESPIGPLTVVRFNMSAGNKDERIWFAFADSVTPSPTQMAFLHAAVSLCMTGLNTARIDYDRERANRRKDEFLAMLGHELRNPLAPLVTTLALIRLKGSGHLAKEHAVMERQVGHLSRLVDDLLDVGRITNDKVDLRLEVFDLRAAVLDAIDSVSPLIKEMKHEITVDIDQLTASVNGDRERMRQVFVNLLVNAVKYTQPGGRIAVAAAQNSKTVSVCIQDNGNGIDGDLLPRVFDLFEQGVTTVDRSRGGLGVGLAIVKKLVSLHSGVATAHSEGLGLGSKFTVRLPRVESKTGLPKIQSTESTNAPCVDLRRVLIVDDNADALDTLEAVLTLHGFEVLAARDPAQALEKAAVFGPDACVLDIGLPGMDGYQLAAQLRRSGGEKINAAQFIALTGYGQASDKARSLAAGFHRHLVKPVAIDELLDALQMPARIAATRQVN